MHRLLNALICAAPLLLAAAAAEARDMALVVGNDRYENVVQLQKAVNDFRAVGDALEKLGFVVRRVENADQRTLSRALVAFDADLAPGDRALFYYAGHGFEIGGTNYILPTDVPAASLNQQDLIRDASFPVQRIVDGIRDSHASVTIMILDACRDNPFAGAGTRSLPTTRGLARQDAPEGVFILMSAGAKQAALDRLSDRDNDPNSVFTRSLLPQLQKPGQTLVQIAKATQIQVRALAASVGQDQVPGYYDQVLGDIVLNEGQGGGAAVVKAGPATAAQGVIVAATDPTRVTGNAPTQIQTGANTQAGAGVSLGAGVTLGPGVIIGGKDAGIAINDPGKAAAAAAGKAIVQGAAQGNVQTAALPPAATAGRAPIANFSRSNAGWTVTISTPEPATAISYRVAASGDFRETGLLDILDQRTGQRMPNPSFQMSGKATATVIEVRYKTPDGTLVGPFPIRFDPTVALYDSQRRALEAVGPNWVEFRDFNGLLVYFTTLVSYRCALTEVRYGLDGADPLRRFDLPPCNADDPFNIPANFNPYLKLPTATKSISLRVTWRDGTQSEVTTVER